MKRILITFLVAFIFSANAYEHQLSITAIFRDDARFLKEWIEFHRLVGVEHFYLYNNLSEDDYQSVLEPYIQEGVVELIEWPYPSVYGTVWNRIQCNSYLDAIKRSTGKTKWLALIDTDEFLVPVQADNLLDVLNEYEDFGGLVVNWQMFGTSNIARIPDDGLMIEHLLLMAPKDHEDNTFVKSIVKPERVKNCKNPHNLIFNSPYYAVNEQFEKISKKNSEYLSVEKIRINHYWTRDEDFFYEVKIAREKKFNRPTDVCLRKSEEFNKVYDDTILRFALALKERMFSIESH